MPRLLRSRTYVSCVMPPEAPESDRLVSISSCTHQLPALRQPAIWQVMACVRKNLAQHSKTRGTVVPMNRGIMRFLSESYRRAATPSTVGRILQTSRHLQMRKVVAIVDDNPAMLNSLDRLLRSVGYDTELFSSGGAFLDGVAASAAACSVIDIYLGDMSGIELGHRLTTLGLAFPIIFMSGTANQAIKQAAIDAGCVAFLDKPFPADLLTEAVERALQARG